jgi:metallo-beta-lactamase class B
MPDIVRKAVIADDYARMFETLAALPADLFLGAHGAYFGLEEKYARLQESEIEAFVDRDGYRKFVADKSAELQAAEKQRNAGAR